MFPLQELHENLDEMKNMDMLREKQIELKHTYSENCWTKTISYFSQPLKYLPRVVHSIIKGIEFLPQAQIFLSPSVQPDREIINLDYFT